MEAAVLTTEAEVQKSFDVVASVRMLRYDIHSYGTVLPETLQRVYDEELTYIAEGMQRPLHTEFRLQSRSGMLVYFDRGSWVPYTSTLVRGLETAEAEAAIDPRKDLQVRRAQQDLLVGYQLQRLSSGQRLQWYSAYPEQEARRYGEAFIAGLGYQPKRKMGFIYQAIGEPDGSVTMHAQSVDRSDEEAFAAAMSQGEAGGDIGDMLQAYDWSLSARHHGRFNAGQEASDRNAAENAWDAIRRHDDLIGHYLQSLETLAASDLSGAELDTAKKRLTYGVWAALRERLDNNVGGPVRGAIPESSNLGNEIAGAYYRLAARGETLFGCGGAISGEAALLAADGKDVFDAIFDGRQQAGETLVWKDGYCRVDNCPTKPGKTKVAQCSVCRGCQVWFDRGRDPSKIYKGLRRMSDSAETTNAAGKKRTVVKRQA